VTLSGDSTAVERFAAGDLDAFEALFREHQHEVYRWIVRIVRDRAAADDLTVETFWRVYRTRARFDPRRPFLPWARRIATRAAIDHLKSARRFVPADAFTDPPAPDTVAQAEARAQLSIAFHALPAPLRAAATLALVEELPYSEIADALDISLSAVKMRVSRDTRLLRAGLEKKGLRP
jgi:RNA polymerase sigma-70 factor (ECF subfamily)